MNKQPVLTAVIIDEFASMAMPREDEVKMRVEQFERLLGRKLETYEPRMFYDTEIRPGTQLVLFDYGGMGFGNSLLDDNSRRLVAWAKDNPSTLVAVVSRFTFQQAVRHELMEQGFADPDGLCLVKEARDEKGRYYETAPLLPNVVQVDSFNEKIPDWFMKGLDDADRRAAGDAAARRGTGRRQVLRAKREVPIGDGGVQAPDDLRRRSRTRPRRRSATRASARGRRD